MAKLFRAYFLKSLFIFWYRFLLRQLKNLIVFHRTISNTFANTTQSHIKYQKFSSLLNRSDLNDHTLVFDVENTLLKSTSLFPYFMLVAFEAGGLKSYCSSSFVPFNLFIRRENGVEYNGHDMLFGSQSRKL